tara:strand:- start:6990 stop:7259 length:270 start_codon:yes stop_codon:yes gene_type:complete
MNREEYTIEFVEDSFSVAKTSSCPSCKGWICFLPDIKSLIKEDCKRVIGLLKKTGVDIKSVDRISVKEWNCTNCKTIYVNIKEQTIVFN